MGELDLSDREALSRRTREILQQCYKFGFEVSALLWVRLRSGALANYQLGTKSRETAFSAWIFSAYIHWI
jgi:hypothetical protein